MIRLIPALFILLFSVVIASANDVYSWEDKDGYHMVDDLGKVPAKYRKKYTIEGRNEAAGYTKAGVVTDSGWDTKLRIAQNLAKLETANCGRKYSNTEHIKTCYTLVQDQFREDIRDIPIDVRKASTFKWE